jgi:hypothetical protein
MLFILVLGLSSNGARADGGVVRVREAQGPFVVTIFAAGELPKDRPADVSVMVQDRDSNDAILDARVDLTFTPPAVSIAGPVEQICGVSEMAGQQSGPNRFTVAATRGQASNKLLYAAPVKFPAAGNWRLQAVIKRGSDVVAISCNLPISPPAGKLAGLLPWLVAPPLMVALFAINQWLRA